MVVLVEQGKEVGKAKDKPIIVNESFRGDFFRGLFFASSDVLYSVDGESRDDVVKKLQVFVFLGD